MDLVFLNLYFLLRVPTVIKTYRHPKIKENSKKNHANHYLISNHIM